MKSVIAYRTGLHIEEVDAGRRGAGVRGGPRGGPARRAGSGSSRSRCSTTSSSSRSRRRRARSVPIQFHTGLGDPDLDLTLVDPAALRLLFSERVPGRPDRAPPHAAIPTSARWPTSRRCSRTSTPTWARSILFAAGRGDRDLPRAHRARAGEQAPVQHGRVARPGAVLDRRPGRAAGARSGARRAHRRRRPRRAHRARLGRADAVAQLGGASTGSDPRPGAAGGRPPDRRGRQPGSNSRSSGTSRWPSRPSRRKVITIRKITARTIWLIPYSSVASSMRRSASASPTIRIAPMIDPLTEPIPPMTSIVMTRNVRSK